MSARKMLSDDAWQKIEPAIRMLMKGKNRHRTDDRNFLEGVLWIARTGAPWRDLPSEFGLSNSL
jgi:transposase